MENIFRVELNLFGIFISVVVIWMFYHQIKNRTKDHKIFMAITYCTISELVLDSIFWIVDNSTIHGGRIINMGVNTLYYILQLLVCYLWANYCVLHMDKKVDKKVRYLFDAVLIFGISMMIVNLYNESVFSVSKDNIYARSWGVWGTLQAVCCGSYILFSIIFVIGRMVLKNEQLKKDGGYLLFVSIVPVIGMVVQIISYGLNTIWSGMSLALLLVLVEVEMKQYHHMEQELADNRIQIMLSQIQPHFLYNSLTSIQSLCTRDPETAKRAIKDFSMYLRANMDSLTSKEPISFRRELDHVKNYLSLEHLRYDDLLHVQYDIEAEDFFLPALTIQPIVENAVKYGIGAKEDGGTITIATYEEENAIVIQVIDDGVGFDVAALEEKQSQGDGRSHVGLSNVKRRLESMVNGTLEAYSEIGEGTTMTITLLKEE